MLSAAELELTIFDSAAKAILLGTGSSVGECLSLARQFAGDRTQRQHLRQLGAAAMRALTHGDLGSAIRSFTSEVLEDDSSDLVRFISSSPYLSTLVRRTALDHNGAQFFPTMRQLAVLKG